MGGGRIIALDVARTAALGGMVVYHFVFDLELYGHLAPGTAMGWPFGQFARLVAGSFLFLSGVSLWLAHGRGFRPRPFLRRLAVIGAAAGLVSLATWAVFPDRFVFFGILHSIAACSVAGLLFLRAIPAVTVAGAFVVAVMSQEVALPLFDHPALAWTGLGTRIPQSVDFVPLFPWLAPFLVGMGLAQQATRKGWDRRLAAWGGAMAERLGWPGRHSLAIYLIHQPVLIGLMMLHATLAR